LNVREIRKKGKRKVGDVAAFWPLQGGPLKKERRGRWERPLFSALKGGKVASKNINYREKERRKSE